MTDFFNNYISQLWDKIWYVLSFAFLDPFWGWGAWLVLLYLIVLAVCYFFGTFWPTLRVIGGVLLLIATFGLFAYARGEKEARAHDAARLPKPKKPAPKTDDGSWNPFGKW